jgi:hypothetical protein
MKGIIAVLFLVSFAVPSWAECVEGNCSNGKGKSISPGGEVYDGD